MYNNKKFMISDKIICNTIIILCFIFIGFVMWIFRNPFVTEYTLEAGSQLEVKDLLKEEAKDATFVDEIDENMLSTVGDYEIKMKANYTRFNVSLHIVDTTPPKATVKSLNMWIGDEITSDLFVSKTTDASPVTTSFLKQPDLTKEGKQNITIIVKDSSGNTTQYQTTLSLKKDVKAPVITVVNTILSNKGEAVLYKKHATVTDNRDEEVELKIDSSKVNYNKAGTYYAVYSATDQAGNKATKKVKVIILDSDDIALKEEAYKLADDFIESVAKDKETKQDKLKACFDYIRNNVKYNGIHQGTIENYYVDAVSGLKTWKGDCLVSNGILRVVCERLDIPTMVVVRTSNRKTNHYWFLADTGDGWYHYDAFKRKEGIVYKWTDSQILSWSKANNNIADFDTSKYPATPKK